MNETKTPTKEELKELLKKEIEQMPENKLIPWFLIDSHISSFMIKKDNDFIENLDKTDPKDINMNLMLKPVVFVDGDSYKVALILAFSVVEEYWSLTLFPGIEFMKVVLENIQKADQINIVFITDKETILPLEIKVEPEASDLVVKTAYSIMEDAKNQELLEMNDEQFNELNRYCIENDSDLAKAIIYSTEPIVAITLSRG